MDIRQQLLEAFAIEYREHLDVIRAALSGGGGRAPDWNDIFRRAHSLKGASRAVDLPAVEAVAHRLETLFERIMAGSAALDRAAFSAVTLALDRIEACVADLQNGLTPSPPEDALAALDACLGASPRESATTAAGKDAGGPAAGIVPTPPEAVSSEAGPTVLRVPADAVEALARATHELGTALIGDGAVAEGLARIRRCALDLGQRAERVRTSAGSAGRPEAGDGRSLDAALAELAALESGLAALARDAAALAHRRSVVASAVDAAVARVREEAERLALVPAEAVFGGFARVLRDMARETGSEVEVTATGLDLPVDRAMLQALKDPVLHALRNALSHGGEPAETRRRAGKPPALAVGLDVAVRGGRLAITVIDDGRGPDLAAIAAAARRRGLLSAEAAADPDALLGLVFEPGFSTSPAVDTLSGRGIGLSVVADTVRRLDGTVRLQPRAPWGTSLSMSLPLSAARRTVLLVEAGDATYALPSRSIERLMRLDRGEVGRVMGRSVLRIAGGDDVASTLPLVHLRDLVGGAAPDPSLEGVPLNAVLLRAVGGRCVLEVDRLFDVRTLLVMPAPPVTGGLRLIAGTVVINGDRPVLVLDAEELVARAADIRPAASVLRSQPQGPQSQGPQQQDPQPRGTIAQARRSTILVVDDSITTRTLEKGILEAAGYRVVVCVDGQDALDRLRAGIEPVDLVVADVEMPRLDGFGLLEALRAEPSFAGLPVILMTSRGDAGDVARGLALGADAYLTKQSFDQGQLLDTVGQLL